MKGYLLIKLMPGLESDALPQIRATSGILEVNLVFGQWDAIAIAEAKNLFELARLVVGEVHGIQGVQDTTTLLQGEPWVHRITSDKSGNGKPTRIIGRLAQDSSAAYHQNTPWYGARVFLSPRYQTPS